jgi:hypothetical protein
MFDFKIQHKKQANTSISPPYETDTVEEEGNDISSGKKAASGKVVEDKIVKEKNKKDDKAGDLFPRFN